MTLVPVDPGNEASVITLLERCAQWLSTAVERSDVEEIASVKVQMETAADLTRRLDLSKEIQEDAREMVRRAEYTLDKAYRKRAADGEVSKGGPRGPYVRNGQTVNAAHRDLDETGMSAREAFGNAQARSEAYQMGAATPEQFNEALKDARDEGNLSRANVVRKVKGQQGPATRDQRADLIEQLAGQGYTSRQMPERVGVSEETVREIARAYGIEIPADRTSVGTRRINGNTVVENTATALEGLAMGVQLIDLAGVDPAVTSQWIDSLTESTRALNRFVRQLKEQIQ